MGKKSNKLLGGHTQYFSKWSKTWQYFTDRFGNVYEPNEKEIKEMKKFNYQIK